MTWRGWGQWEGVHVEVVGAKSQRGRKREHGEREKSAVSEDERRGEHACIHGHQPEHMKERRWDE